MTNLLSPDTTHFGNVRLSSKNEVTRVRPPKQLEKMVLKAVLLGDYGVGKTTLFRRIREQELVVSEGSISWNSQSMDLCNTTITTSDKKKVELNLWDTAGAERYRTLTLDFFRKALIVFLVYRTDNPSTLANLRVWKTEAATYAPPGTMFVLVGNIITDSKVELSTETADDFANTEGISIHFRLSITTTPKSSLTGMLTRVVEEVLKSRSSDTVARCAPTCTRTIILHKHPSTQDLDDPENSPSKRWCWCS